MAHAMLWSRYGGRSDPRRVAEAIGAAALALAVATIAVWLLHRILAVPYASPLYLLAVLGVGMRYGTWPAVLTSVGAFVVYDFLFVPPLYELTIADPLEWLNLFLFLAVAITIGRLAALLAERAQEAYARAHEAQALYEISRALASTSTVGQAAPQVLERLVTDTRIERAWLAVGPDRGTERVVWDTAPDRPRPDPTWLVVLERRAAGGTVWVRTHEVHGLRRAPRGVVAVYQAPLVAGDQRLGSLWMTTGADREEPDPTATRIIMAAADQLSEAIRRDALTREATAAEIARQSEQIKTALLDSVSHDLRTPLATIRASAGSLLDSEIQWSPDEQRAALRAIDIEADRLNRLVRNLLDLSRIEGGALHPELEPHDLADVVAEAAARLPVPSGKRLQVDVPASLPPVLVDDLYLDQIVANLVENAVRHGGDAIAVRGVVAPDGEHVDLVVEDDGPGVRPENMPRLFEKFYRGEPSRRRSRQGMGVGLTVVRGLARAMGGEVEARQSALGGLAVTVRLRAVEEPVASPAGTAG